jgi:hypothetical protein
MYYRPDNTITAEDGQPWWRVVTLSTGASGIAPICVYQATPKFPHDLSTQLGESGPPRFDEMGVYDCCPEPHLQCWSPATAVKLLDTLNQLDIRLDSRKG